MSLVMLTVDRYLSIHQGMRYTVIMKTSKGWWMVLLTWLFCLCMGSIVFTVTNLIENHECTYVFSIAKVTSRIFFSGQTFILQEVQLSTTIIVLISIVAVFSFYGVILTKFYRRKKKLEEIQASLKEREKEKPKDSFLRRCLGYFSSKKEKCAVQMKEIKSRTDNGDAILVTQKTRRKKSSVTKQLSFHVSYLRSSNYVLVTLLVFFMCHAPLFVHQMIEVTK